MIRQFTEGKVDETQGNFKVSINHKLNWRKFSGTRGSLESQGGMEVYNSNGEMTIHYIGGQKITFSYDSEGRMKESIQ